MPGKQFREVMQYNGVHVVSVNRVGLGNGAMKFWGGSLSQIHLVQCWRKLRMIKKR